MDNPPLIIYKPKGTKILVFAPHQDDEILGCGGILRKHILSGDKVYVIYMTDGRKGCPSHIETKDISAVRKNEAMASCEKIGIDEMEFAPFRDGGLRLTKEARTYVMKQIIKINPDIIYTPHPNEPHPDHKECTNIVVDAVDLTGITTNIYFYEVWNFLKPTHLVNITDVIKDKIEALREYSSQLFNHDYETMIKSLNSYRMQQIYNKKLLFKKIKAEQKERKKINMDIKLPWQYAEAIQYKSMRCTSEEQI
ncbi:PIG-L family deacetylase [Cytobacillus kochii]|uniref:PIG-L deacetylase family protein n=1 Tax=Cytobacillus kochii TaxID=859143 RepID=UPI001CD7415D|nr:PIG-L family deacetylase [Cytobacillus kochii]MCA1028630.1 PIG-L family deacetylase [Cytobacillus kochii]